MAQGGPWTREDPANPDKKSCLDLAIISKGLLPFVKKLVIDKAEKFSPIRATQGKIIKPDHYPMILTFENMPGNNHKSKPEEIILLNTNKEGAWKDYSEATENCEELIDIFNDNINDITESVKRFEKEFAKIKNIVFGKVKFKIKNTIKNPKLSKLQSDKQKVKPNDDSPDDADGQLEKIEENIREELIRKQREEIEKELKDLKSKKKVKGVSAAIFSLKGSIVGSKKQSPEAISIIDPVSGKRLFDHEEIRTASLNYVTSLLKNNETKDQYKLEITAKNIVHEVRMQEKIDSEDHSELKIEDFTDIIKNLHKKNKEKYKFLLRAGHDLKMTIFKMFQYVWNKEKKPDQIVQIY